MSDVSQGPDWWKASDGRWYAPDRHPDLVGLHPDQLEAAGDVFRGADSVFAAAGTDNVVAEAGKDDVFAAAGTDDVFATAGPDLFPRATASDLGGPADDVFATTATDDVFEAAATDNLFSPASSSVGNYPTTEYPSAPPGAQKSKVAAGVLAIFLGWLGIHRFYLGHKRLGITMLLLSVLSFGILIPLIVVWGIVEGVFIFSGVMKNDAYGEPLA